jgi:hypothetical protein
LVVGGHYGLERYKGIEDLKSRCRGKTLCAAFLIIIVDRFVVVVPEYEAAILDAVLRKVVFPLFVILDTRLGAGAQQYSKQTSQ